LGAKDRGEYRQAAAVASDHLIRAGSFTLRKADILLKLMAAGLAEPDVPNTTIRDMPGPFRCDYIRTALRALIH
jgi:hypothetical protein